MKRMYYNLIAVMLYPSLAYAQQSEQYKVLSAQTIKYRNPLSGDPFQTIFATKAVVTDTKTGKITSCNVYFQARGDTTLDRSGGDCKKYDYAKEPIAAGSSNTIFQAEPFRFPIVPAGPGKTEDRLQVAYDEYYNILDQTNSKIVLCWNTTFKNRENGKFVMHCASAALSF